MKKHVEVSIFGKVQGVWFRASTRDQARSLGLSGFVRNEDDGSVYAEFEGPEAAVDAMLRWCQEGPAHARVDRVVIRDGEGAGFSGFQIQR